MMGFELGLCHIDSSLPLPCNFQWEGDADARLVFPSRSGYLTVFVLVGSGSNSVSAQELLRTRVAINRTAETPPNENPKVTHLDSDWPPYPLEFVGHPEKIRQRLAGRDSGGNGYVVDRAADQWCAWRIGST